MEKFLAFWSHNNAVIIESLVALILISTIYLVYRAFFGSKTQDGFDGSAGAGVNTVQIEKTLQKILDQQGSKSGGHAGATAGAPAELVLELNTVKLALEEKEKQIVVLQAKAVEAAKAAQAPNASPSADAIAAAAQAAAGLAEKERNDYEAKIKELEARLGEYEIISEDIADLSFFKEENARLTKELESLRLGAAATPAVAAAGVAAPVEPAIAKAAPVAPPVVEPTPTPDTVPVAAAEATPAPAAAPAPAPTPVIDESLIAEFAKAVESQTSGDEPKKDDNEKLLAEFENFNKKS